MPVLAKAARLRRHDTRSTLMTSPPIEDWGKLLGYVPAARAILNRLLFRSDIIPMTGRSHRLAQFVSEAHSLPTAFTLPATGRGRQPFRGPDETPRTALTQALLGHDGCQDKIKYHRKCMS